MTLPALYPELPTESLVATLREELMRVTRREYGGHMVLAYRMDGVCGEWRLQPVNYYVSGAPKHKGRKGPYEVTEYLVSQTEPYVAYGTKGETRTFESEQAAWEYVRAEHRKRVEAKLPELAVKNAQVALDEADAYKQKANAEIARAEAWQAIAQGFDR